MREGEREGVREGEREGVRDEEKYKNTRKMVKVGSQYDVGAVSIMSVMNIMGKSVFFTSQILFLMSIFPKILLIGHRLTLAMQH